MGIEVWSLRAPRQTAFYGYTLYRHQKPVGWLLADKKLKAAVWQDVQMALRQMSF